MYLLYRKFKQDLVDQMNIVQVKNKRKIFCIGRNKTGTTSLKKAFEDLGFIVGNQRKAELLLRYYIKKDFKPIIDYCKSGEVFQDVPFSYPETFKFLDQAYPNSKFILSVRDNAEQWYNSVTKFHAKIFGKGEIPTAAQLKAASYVWPGWMWEGMQENYNLSLTNEGDPYNKELLINHYNHYNATVIEYFKDRPKDLIVVNLAESGAYERLMNFLNINSPYNDFPWENKTAEKVIRI